MAAVVRGWTLSRELVGKSIIIFLFGIATGQDQQQSPRTSPMQNVSGNVTILHCSKQSLNIQNKII